MIENTNIHIRLAQKNDAIQVSVLLRKLGLDLPDEKEVDKINSHWDRLWKYNPYYTKFKEEILYGWVMEDDGRIVGFFGCIPRLYSINSTLVPVAIASQWGVEKDYRKFTNLLCDQFFKENPISLKLVTTAIKPTGRIFEKYGGHQIPSKEMETVYMIPIHLFKLIIHKYHQSAKKHIFKLLSFVIPWKLQFKFIRKNDNLKEINIQSMPDDIDIFFKRNINKTKGLIALRNSEILKWFYPEEKKGLIKKIFIYTADKNTVGFASIIDEPIKDNATLKRYKIVDLIADNSRIKKAIIKALIRYTYEMKVDILEVHFPGMISKKEIPAFVLERKLPQFPLFYQTADNAMEDILKDSSNWNIMPFDGDTSLG
jgi:hypothetical protein